MESKEELIEQIKKLISSNPKDSVDINPNYLEYFEQEELLEIKENLEFKKSHQNELNKDFLDEIYESCS